MAQKIASAFLLFLFFTITAATAQDGIWRPDCHELARAVMNQEIATVRMGLQFNPSRANARDNTGWSLLHCAVVTGDYEITLLLLDARAFVNAQSEDGSTPLHQAIIKGKIRIVELLLSRGASLTIEDNKGNTPLNLAENMGRKEIAEVLRKKGAVK